LTNVILTTSDLVKRSLKTRYWRSALNHPVWTWVILLKPPFLGLDLGPDFGVDLGLFDLGLDLGSCSLYNKSGTK